MTDSRKRLLVLAFAALLYVPLTFLGYGTDDDSYGAVISGNRLVQTHVYIPSRPPGYFVHEAATGILNAIGGSVFSNLGTVVAALCVLYFFMRLCERDGVPHPHLLAITLAIHPIFWANATCTIDYVWAMAFVLASHHLCNARRYVPAALLGGLAAGARMSSILLIVILAAVFFVTRADDRKRVLGFLMGAGLVSALCYVPSFIHAGYSLGFMTYFTVQWSFTSILARFVYKNIYFWGLQGSLVLALVIAPLSIRNLRDLWKERVREIAFISILAVAAFELLFVKLPLESGYLLPMLPYALILVSLLLRGALWPMATLAVALFSYAFVSANVARPDVANIATTATTGLWIERGYLITNAIARIEARKRYGDPLKEP